MAGRVETLRDMRQAGYTFRNKSACKACGAAIEWWLTTNKRSIPYNPLPEATPQNDNVKAVAHWTTCPKADELRGTGTTATAKQTSQTRERLVGTLRATTNARAILALYDEGPVVSWQGGIPAEDLRAEAITAANRLRNAVLLHGEREK